ncbi:MAG: hypothetical protein KDD45_06955 [Bdellovibrionales bacterium]|nr:hypothetical protein [Bdellovibrionales bacterium]
MKKKYPIFSFVLFLSLGCASSATQPSRRVTNDISLSQESKLSEENLLAEAKKNALVAAYLMQDNVNIDLSQLIFMKAPGTRMLCTLMGNGNSCSMSFRVLTIEGRTIMAGAIHYDGQTQRYSIFRILEGAPDSSSDFESWSKF